MLNCVNLNIKYTLSQKFSSQKLNCEKHNDKWKTRVNKLKLKCPIALVITNCETAMSNANLQAKFKS